MAEDGEFMKYLLKEIESFLEKVKEMFEFMENVDNKKDHKNVKPNINT